MTVAALFARAAEGDLVEERDVVGDNRGLTGHESRGVVEQDAHAELGGGMDVDRQTLGGERLQVEGEVTTARAPERMGEPVDRDGVEALVPEERGERVFRGRVAFERGADVGAHLGERFRIGGDRVGERASQERQRVSRGGKTLGETFDDRLAQRGAVEDEALQGWREDRFGGGDLLGAGAELRPEGGLSGADQGYGTGVGHRFGTPDQSPSGAIFATR